MGRKLKTCRALPVPPTGHAPVPAVRSAKSAGRAGPGQQGPSTLSCPMTCKHTCTKGATCRGTHDSEGPLPELEQGAEVQLVALPRRLCPRGSDPSERRHVDDTEGAPARRASKSSRGMTSSQRPWGQAEIASEEEEEGAREPRGHSPISPCSEPDLITAHTGHSIDIAQHGEPDETCRGKDVTRLSKPHCLEAGRALSARGDSEALAEAQGLGTAGEEGWAHVPVPRLVRRPPGSGSSSSGRLLF